MTTETTSDTAATDDGTGLNQGDYRLDLKAGFGNANFYLVEIASGKKFASANMGTGEVMANSTEHKALLIELIRQNTPDLFEEEGEPETDTGGASAEQQVSELLDTPAVIPPELRQPGSSDMSSANYRQENVQKGNAAEQRTAGVLSVLLNDPSARMLNCVDLGTRDIDHVLFTRKGVFVLNTKYRRVVDTVEHDFRNSWADKVSDDVREVASVCSVLAEACNLELTRLYTPMVVLWTEREDPIDWIVTKLGEVLIDGRNLVKAITGVPDTLSGEMTVALYETYRSHLANKG